MRLIKKIYNIQNCDTSVIRDSFKSAKKCNNTELTVKKIRILYLGGDSKLKGWSTVKKLLIEMKKDLLIHFIVAGEVNESSKVYSGNIEYTGLVTDVSSLYCNCDIVIFPSRKAHQARPIFEAGYYSKPVIVSDFLENHEQVINDHNGILVKPNSYLKLKEAIFKLVSDPNLIHEYGKNNYLMYRDKHNFETNKKKTIQLLESRH